MQFNKVSEPRVENFESEHQELFSEKINSKMKMNILFILFRNELPDKSFLFWVDAQISKSFHFSLVSH